MTRKTESSKVEADFKEENLARRLKEKSRIDVEEWPGKGVWKMIVSERR